MAHTYEKVICIKPQWIHDKTQIYNITKRMPNTSNKTVYGIAMKMETKFVIVIVF